MKRAVLFVVVFIVLVLVVPSIVLAAMTFGGMKELVDGTELPGDARLVKDGYVAIAVIPAGDGAVALVDCGNDPNGVAVLTELKRRGLAPDAVKAIFLSHGHPDHVAGCHLFGNAQVLALPQDIPVAEGTGRSKGPVPSMFDTPPDKRAKVTRPLADGETVTVGSLAVKVYAVPGHTAGSAAFLANDTLYLGDNAAAGDDGKLVPAPWVFSDDTKENRRSLEALGARLKTEGAAVKKLAFAHSGPLDGIDALAAFKAQE